MRLICKNFPWTIEINEGWVYCARVWDAVYSALQQPIKPSEWALIAHDRVKVNEIKRAHDERLNRRLDEG